MKQHRYGKSLLAAAALVAVMGIGATTAAATDIGGTPASWLPARLRLVGVWDVKVTLRDCVSGNAIVTFPAMNQYAVDGSQIEFGVNISPALRYPSLGTWHYIGPRKYASSFSFFRFNPDGSYAGTQDVQRTITLSNDANHFSSAARVQIYNPSHQLLKGGCASEVAVRR